MKRTILIMFLSLALIITMMPLAPSTSYAKGNGPVVKGVPTPVAEEPLTTDGITVTGDGFTLESAAWCNKSRKTVSGTTFKLDKEYWIKLVIKTPTNSDEYVEYDPPNITINGKDYSIDEEGELSYKLKGYLVTYWAKIGKAGTNSFAITAKKTDGDTAFKVNVKDSLAMKAYNPPEGDILYTWWNCDSNGENPGYQLMANYTGKFTPAKLGFNYGKKYFLVRAFAENGQIAEVVLCLTCYYNLSAAKVIIKNCTYNGKSGRTPSVTVKAKLNGTYKTLVKGTDYTIKYGQPAKKRKDVDAYPFALSGKKYFTSDYDIEASENWEDEDTDGDGAYYEYSFKILPKGTAVKSVLAGSKKLTVKWNKQSKKMSKKRITGYQVQVATNKAFTKNKKSVKVKGYTKTNTTIKNLKGGKKYYVRVRTYKKFDYGIFKYTCYSKWSKVKTKTTRY